jgi:ornithine decarboxylase
LHKHHRTLGLASPHVGNRDVAAIAEGRPVQPVTLLRPHAARRAARFFVEKFPGRSLYAVKANPSPDLLDILWESGITHYDVASIAEVRLVARTLPEATLCFMHPVKAEEAIEEAYFTHGVRTFSLDTMDELEKIVRATKGASDLNLCVRLRVSSDHSKLSLASKFGAEPGETKALLFAARQAADALGICFHVGSQAMSPAAYAEAMSRVRAAIVEAAVTVDIVDVGGGFPSSYPGMEPPPLGAYFDVIHNAFESLPVSYSSELWCEPGRALCAEYAACLCAWRSAGVTICTSMTVAYGPRCSMRPHVGWRFPVKLMREPASDARDMGFQLLRTDLRRSRPYGGTVHAAADVQAATISRSACSALMAAQCGPGFNGFGSIFASLVEDEPMTSLYADVPAREIARNNVVKL